MVTFKDHTKKRTVQSNTNQYNKYLTMHEAIHKTFNLIKSQCNHNIIYFFVFLFIHFFCIKYCQCIFNVYMECVPISNKNMFNIFFNLLTNQQVIKYCCGASSKELIYFYVICELSRCFPCMTLMVKYLWNCLN